MTLFKRWIHLQQKRIAVAFSRWNFSSSLGLKAIKKIPTGKCNSCTCTLQMTKTVDSRQDVVLVMLDLSAAFDTLDHTVLLDRLSRYLSFSHTVLRWFSSYLAGRIQSVTIVNTTSSSQRLEFRVPQGSILCPPLFTSLYSTYSRHNLCS